MHVAEDGNLYFDSGRYLIHDDVVSISGDSEVWHGHDGYIGSKRDFSHAERVELAEYQIALWRQFAEAE